MKNLLNMFSKASVLALPLCLACFASCDEDIWKLKDDSKGAYVLTEGLPAASMLEEYEEFTEWVNVLRYSDTYSVLNSMNDGSGSAHTFTIFAPTNEALQSYYQEKGVTGIEQLGVDYAAALVKTMVYDGDSLKLTELFTADVDSLQYKSESDEYLYIKVDTTGGFSLTSQSVSDAKHISRNYIECSNGFVYTADGVLSPLVETVYERVASSSGFSIMTAALQATGYDQRLSVVADTTYVLGARRVTNYYYTLLNVSDQTYADNGINSLDDLKSALLAHSSTPEVGADSLLKEYVQYHLFDASYNTASLTQMVGVDTVRIWGTMAPNQIMMISRSIQSISSTLDSEGAEVFDTTYVYYFNTDDIAGQSLISNSAQLCKNGYVHEVQGWLPVYEPKQTTVVWDLADYSEVRNICLKNEIPYQPSSVVTTESKIDLSSLSSYTVVSGNDGSQNTSYSTLCYVTCKSNLSSCLNLDRVVFNMGYLGSVTMNTPTLVKGKYKVTISMAYLTDHSILRTCNGTKGGMMRIWIDLPSTDYTPTSDEWETYHKLDCAPYTTITKSLPGVYETVLYDEIEFTETASHSFKFVIMDPAASTSSKFSLQFDAITFTPIE